ncbi:unnamed protein product [Peronospora belbahrii]|uniref:Peptidase C1A papain C-terminal domain-containing protein n=1 Tax=Peronospora belbahrii TaxID=622444 RepID=A0AAU9KVI1_9STRA|nr:unnamed protein product [Peronospora belbahrii]CAH0516173.1 unnamed protein product [Peronospora belbahrii]
MHVQTSLFMLSTAIVARSTAHSTTTRSFGTLVDCPAVRSAESPCLWVGENNEVVASTTLRELLVQRHFVSYHDQENYSRNLQNHMKYIEDVHMHAKSVDHVFSYHMGVNERHLTSSTWRRLSPQQLVDQEVQSARSRRLVSKTNDSLAKDSSKVFHVDGSKYWNWCGKENPFGHSVCSSVKSQQNCGSCWAFAAADAIETAVVIAENASAAVSLSPQQFLTCSRLETTQTFEYCWATDDGVDGAIWMERDIKWESQNDGCNGGMTHGAFIDAAQSSWGLVTELTMPYDDSASSHTASDKASLLCNVSANETAASITGWEQVVGTDCTASSTCSVLLRLALEKQPIAVAINSEDPFGEYAGGFYSCPNNGDLSSKNDVNHAMVLVGYGTDASHGDYWILKNSYGSSWGTSGFMNLLADSKVNCGLNIFPVIPTGASAGAASSISIDSGGETIFVGLSPNAWIVVAGLTTIFTVVTTAIGMLFSHHKMRSIRKKNSAIYAARANGR